MAHAVPGRSLVEELRIDAVELKRWCAVSQSGRKCTGQREVLPSFSAALHRHHVAMSSGRNRAAA